MSDSRPVHVDLTSVARWLLRCNEQAVASRRPTMTHARAEAKLESACETVHRFGFGMTPTQIRMTVIDVVNTLPPRPAQLGQVQRDWWEESARQLADVLWTLRHMNTR
jgi:hypothetical protein